jgi:hypothetical protein
MLKFSFISSSLTIYYVQSSHLWLKTPLLPFRSIFSLFATDIWLSYAFWVGVGVHCQVATVAFVALPMLLFGNLSSKPKGNFS